MENFHNLLLSIYLKKGVLIVHIRVSMIKKPWLL